MEKILKKFCSQNSYLVDPFSKLPGPSGRAVCGRSPAEIVGSNPTGSMDV